MFATARNGVGFVCIVLTEPWKAPFHALVPTNWLWLNNYQEIFMNKDQIKGRVEEAKGKVKEAAGVILDDDAMEIEGNVQKNVGKVQSGLGDLKEDIKKEK
jgi:uncharacterized protein YjbJ (UPF0337 family)